MRHTHPYTQAKPPAYFSVCMCATCMCRSGGLSLAVLHPRKLVVYACASQNGNFMQVCMPVRMGACMCAWRCAFVHTHAWPTYDAGEWMSVGTCACMPDHARWCACITADCRLWYLSSSTLPETVLPRGLHGVLHEIHQVRSGGTCNTDCGTAGHVDSVALTPGVLAHMHTHALTLVCLPAGDPLV